MADIHFLDDDEAVATGEADDAVLAALHAGASAEEAELLQGEGGVEEEDEGEYDHLENLAEKLSEKELGQIAADIIERVEQDEESRKYWRERFAKGLKNLGITEDKTPETLFEGASTVVHPVIAEAAVQFQARAMAELFPPKGPVKTVVIGESSQDLIEQADRVEEHMNYQLTEGQQGYADELDDMLFYLPFSGSAFKKCYRAGGDVSSNYLQAEAVVVSYHASAIEDATRVTHKNPISQNDMRKLQHSGFYLDVKLDTPSEDKTSDKLEEQKDELEGAAPEIATDEDNHTVLECYCDYDLPGEFKDENGIAWPYIISVDKNSSKTLAIRRNWREGDDEKREKRIWFVHYKLLPGFGFYGFGFIHLIGGLGKAATGALRSLLDAAAFANLPAGFKMKGVKTPGGEIRLAPGEFAEVEGDSDDIRKMVTALPFKEPSKALFELLGFLVEAAQRFASTTEAQVGDASNTGPVGTTLALIEQGSKVYSGIHARLHRAQKREFRLIAELMHEAFDQPGYRQPDNIKTRKEDFDGTIDVVPVSDPKIFSQTQRIAQAQAALDLADRAPEMHNRYEAYRRMYEALDVAEIDEILLDLDEVEPADPVSENMNLLTGSAVRAFDWQDHASHLAVHQNFMEDPNFGGNPNIQEAIIGPMMSHMAEHLAYLYRQQAMERLGQPLPLPDLNRQPGKKGDQPPLPPQMQNQIAMAVAQSIAQEKPQQPPSPEEQALEMERQQAEAEIQMKDAQTKAEIARKDAETEAKILRENERTKAEIARKDHESAAGMKQDAGKAMTDIALKDQETAAKIKLAEERAKADQENKSRSVNQKGSSDEKA